jgi:hypothetical protein
MAKSTSLFAVVAIACCIPSPLVAKPIPVRPAVRVIVVYTGTVDSRSAERLTSLISRNTDKVIGLKLTVAQSQDSDERYYSSISEEQ